MTEQAIVRTQIVVVGEVGTNTYGDLTFTDKEGGQYKVSVKRKQYFDKVIIPGTAVQLNYASAYGKEYIYSATQVKDGLPPPQLPQPHPTTNINSGDMPPRPDKILSKEEIQVSRDERIDKAVWYKELGACLRSGDIDKTTPQGKVMRTAYYTEMLRVLGIKGKEVQIAKNHLVEAAKKIEATEIGKED